MSMYDWNGDGKKDAADNFIEYNICQDSTKGNGDHNYSRSSDGNVSTLGAIGCAVGGFLATALLFSGTDLDHIPTIFLLLIWFTLSVLIGWIVNKLKH